MTRPLREIKTRAKAPEEQAEPVSVVLDGVTISGRRPKSSVMARTLGVVGDKYAPDEMVAKVAFDFLEATLDRESWTHVMGRINDRDDDFDAEELTDLTEALFAELEEQAKAQAIEDAPNREAKRAVARSAGRRG